MWLIGKKKFNRLEQKKQKKRSKILKIALIILIPIAIIGLIIFLLCFTNIFTINQFVIEGNESISKEEILKTANYQINSKNLYLISQNNILLFSKSKLIKSIQNKYVLDEVKIDKKLFKKNIIITIKEKYPTLVLIVGENYFYLDDKGIVFEKIPVIELVIDNGKKSLDTSKVDPLLPKLYDTNTPTINLGQRYLKTEKTSFILKLDHEISKIPELKPRKYLINNSEADELKAITILEERKEIEIVFNFKDNLEIQIQRLKIVLKEKRGEVNKYIDLKYGEKIYIN